MVVFLRWGLFFGIALLIPVTLPAGAGFRQKPQVKESNFGDPLLSGDRHFLRSSPVPIAPPLRELKVGTPLKVLRSWKSEDGTDWVYVHLESFDEDVSGISAKRGWLSA